MWPFTVKYLLLELVTTTALFVVSLLISPYLFILRKFNVFWLKVGPKKRKINEVKVCNDVWLHIFRFVEPAQLGLKLALLSRRFDCLVETHFKSRKLSLGFWKIVRPAPNDWTLRRFFGEPVNQKAVIYKFPDYSSYINEKIEKLEELPLPEVAIPHFIRGFRWICIEEFENNAIAFLRNNRRLLQSADVTLDLYGVIKSYNSNDTVRDEANSDPLHPFFVSQILPLIKPTKCGSDCEINKIIFNCYENWHEMFLSTSPTCQWSTTIRLITYVSNCFASLVPDRIWSSPLHPLSKWLHTARSDGQPKVIKVHQLYLLAAVVDGLKTLFFNATASVNFLVVFEQITFFKQDGPALDNFVLDNGQTNERLSFRRVPGGTYGQMFLMERGPKKRGRNEQQWTRWRQEALEEFPLRDVLSFKFDHL